jgi:hypothetical protein
MLSKHQGLVRPEWLSKLKKLNDLIGSRTRDLPVCKLKYISMKQANAWLQLSIFYPTPNVCLSFTFCNSYFLYDSCSNINNPEEGNDLRNVSLCGDMWHAAGWMVQVHFLAKVEFDTSTAQGHPQPTIKWVPWSPFSVFKWPWRETGHSIPQRSEIVELYRRFHIRLHDTGTILPLPLPYLVMQLPPISCFLFLQVEMRWGGSTELS